jgi:hypothetical protein
MRFIIFTISAAQYVPFFFLFIIIINVLPWSEHV